MPDLAIEIYYRRATLYPTIFVVTTSTLITYFENVGFISGFQLTNILKMNLGASFVYSIVISALCIPIYMIKLKFIRRHKVFTILCWFLLPFLFIGFIIYKSFNPDWFNLLDLSIRNLLFVVSLIWTYRIYCRNNMAGLIVNHM